MYGHRYTAINKVLTDRPYLGKKRAAVKLQWDVFTAVGSFASESYIALRILSAGGFGQ